MSNCCQPAETDRLGVFVADGRDFVRIEIEARGSPKKRRVRVLNRRMRRACKEILAGRVPDSAGTTVRLSKLTQTLKKRLRITCGQAIRGEVPTEPECSIGNNRGGGGGI